MKRKRELFLGLLFSTFCLIISTSTGEGDVAGSVNLDSGWRLWLDKQASWKDDAIYLPDEVDLTKLPVNPPSGGWSTLSESAGIPVSLPGTVEEHYWGENAASLSAEQVVEASHAYLGVSWWYRSFTAPALQPGERLILSFPGARMRAEVYVNGKLISYNLITEAPFTADATDALKPDGPNLLAVRITNPGGGYAWEDFTRFSWGKYELPQSHGYGGMAGGVTMAIRAPVSVTDLAVLNTPEVRTVSLIAKVQSTGPAYNGPLKFSIHDASGDVWSGKADVSVAANHAKEIKLSATVPGAKLWDIGQPNLYTAAASLPSAAHSDRSTDFGFRWFTAKGLGTDAKLYLNDHRVVVRSAISWGHWAPNGMFPDTAAVQREVDSVHALGLTAIQNHRHMPKEIVLAGFDHAGLLRYCEAGGGSLAFDVTSSHDAPPVHNPVDTSGKGGEATFFYERYERAKLLAMVRAFRSHPSIPLWTVQNETEPDLGNPKLFQVMREMHAMDPSRILVLKSGIDIVRQAWVLPYSDDFMHDDGTGASGWRDEHSAGDSPGVYTDSMYTNPDDFKYRSTNQKEIVAWGEMATSASPDDHQAMAKWYQDHNIPGYDRAAHETLTSVYEKFLDDFHFRSDFPTAGDIFRGAAAKHYFAAARLLENARICDAVDYIVLSGWESTITDNHSGMVDELHQPKGDPAPLKEANASKVLVVRPRHLVVAKGDSATVDVHLVNEDNLNGTGTLAVSASTADGQSCFQGSFPVTITGGETFGQLLKDNIQFALNSPGMVTVTASLTTAGSSTPVLSRTAQILVVDPQPTPLTRSVAYLAYSDKIGEALHREFGLQAAPLTASSSAVDDIVLVGRPTFWKKDDVSAVKNTDDPGLYTPQRFGPPGVMVAYTGLAPGALKVELFFADGYATKPGVRVFDVALNGQTVLKDFDIFKETGGKGHALVKTFNVASPDGTLKLTFPAVAKNFASMAALRITDSQGKTIREVFRAGPYRDPKGVVWQPVTLDDVFDVRGAVTAALDRVRQGSRLIILTNGADTERAAQALAEAKLLDYSGMVGPSDAPWTGFWYFGKKHWLLDGLPAGCVLDWPYQISDMSNAQSDGMMIQSPQLDAVIGYGRDHCTKLGLGAAVLPVGKGSVVLCCMPGLAASFMSGKADGFNPVTAKRILFNALQGGGN